MGTEINALAAVDADIDSAVPILHDRLHRADRNALTALNAELFLEQDAATFALGQGPGRAGRSTGRRVTGQTAFGGKTGGQAAG